MYEMAWNHVIKYRKVWQNFNLFKTCRETYLLAPTRTGGEMEGIGNRSGWRNCLQHYQGSKMVAIVVEEEEQTDTKGLETQGR